MSLRIRGAVKRALDDEAQEVYRAGGLLVLRGKCMTCGEPAYAKHRISGVLYCRADWIRRDSHE